MVKIDSLQELLGKKVSRKEFLTHIGLAVLSIVGISGMIKNINQSIGGANKKHKVVDEPGGYGYGTYSDVPPKSKKL